MGATQPSKNLSPTQATQQEILDRLESFPAIYSEYGIAGINTYAESLNDEWKKQSVLIAVIGRVGSGKSTFINRIRGLKPDDPNAAETKPGAAECTTERREYPAAGTGIIYVDLPGVGTKRFRFDNDKSRKCYCDKFSLAAYDYYLLITKDRFQLDEINLAEYIKSTLKKNFSLVYTHIDVDLLKYPAQMANTEQDFMQIKEKLRKELYDGCDKEVPDKIFLISNQSIFEHGTGNFVGYNDDSRYELNDLIENITNGLELHAKKQTAFIMSLNPICEKAIKQKANYLRLQASLWAAASGGIGAIPIPGTSLVCDAAIVLIQAAYYNETFGTGKTLGGRLLLEKGTQKEKLAHLIRELTALLGIRFTAVCVAQAAEEAVKVMPIIGSIVGVNLSFASTMYILQSLISLFEKEALQLLEATRKQ